uniref:F-ATPase delta subunit n=1 Tax=Hydra vulgaris TaxID=6087 RepID=T2MGB3_HYDVU
MALFLKKSVLNKFNIRILQSVTKSRRSYADVGPSDSLSLTFGTPRETFFNNAVVTQVDVPSGSGNFCILAQHVPIIAVLRPGLLTVTKDGSVEKYFVSSGTITVNKDSTAQILAEEASPLDRFDLNSARKAAEDARSALSVANTEALKAEAQIQVDTCDALLFALDGK